MSTFYKDMGAFAKGAPRTLNLEGRLYPCLVIRSQESFVDPVGDFRGLIANSRREHPTIALCRSPDSFVEPINLSDPLVYGFGVVGKEACEEVASQSKAVPEDIIYLIAPVHPWTWWQARH